MDWQLGLETVRRRLVGRYEEWRHRGLDRRYGIDTSCTKNPAADAGALLAAYHGYHYEPIQLDVFKRIVRALPISPARLTLIDFGCGKGRALVLAAEHGFRRVVGIECDASLFAVAQRNVQAYRSARKCDIELHLGNAVHYELPGEDCLCFLYNPFDEVAMAETLARIAQSLQRNRRKLLVAYRNPRHGALLAGAPFLRNLVRNRTFELYEGIDA